MSKFKDFLDVFDPLILPIGGKDYTIPLISAKDAAWFDLASDPNVEDVEPVSDPEFMRMFLGDAYAQMIADNVPDAAITRAAMTALAYRERGVATAEVMWETGGDPKAISAFVTAASRPNRAARRSKSTGGGSSTKRPASSNGTKSPQAPSPKQAKP